RCAEGAGPGPRGATVLAPPARSFPLPSGKAVLPNADAVGGGEIEALARLDGEGGVPGVQVADGVGPVLGGSVAVGQDPLAEGRLAGLRAPALGERDEELLGTGQAVHDRRFLALEGQAVAVVGGGEARDVGDVLRESQPSVDREVGEGTIRVVLLD